MNVQTEETSPAIQQITQLKEKRAEWKDRESFKFLHCNALILPDKPIVLYSDVFPSSMIFFFLNKRCMMINEPCGAFRDGVLYRLQNTHPMRGSRAIPLGFSRSSCRIVTQVFPLWSQTNILSVTRSTKQKLPVNQSMAICSTSAI